MEKTVADIIAVMESIAPAELAESWDNVGLQLGQRDWPVKHVRVALDPAPTVVDNACRQGVDLLVTHHPLLFRPLKNVDFNTPVGKIIAMAVRHKLAIFSAHTNFDAVADGLNDMLASQIGLEDIALLSESPEQASNGFGRIGRLPEASDLVTFAGAVRKMLRADTVRYAGDPKLQIRRAAVCSGSGGGLLQEFLSSDAEVYVTGDIRYHDARTVEWFGKGVIDVGHFISEHLMVERLAAKLRGIFDAKNCDVTVDVCALERAPFTVVW